MFERYSDKARRVIFFARYEASQFGSPAIDAEHLLLGILRESPDLLRSVAGSDAVERIRERMEKQLPIREKISTSVDLPFTEAAKHVLNSALEEADQLGNRSIEPVHLLVGLLRENNCFPQGVLGDLGVTLESVRHREERGEKVTEEIFGGRITGKAVPTQQFRKVVSDAIDEATLLGSMSARPEHLLLGLLRNENSLAAKILREAALDYEGVRRKLEESRPGK